MGKYAGTIQQIADQDAQQGARAAGLNAPAIDPDSMGRAMRVADARGLPPGVVATNLGEFDQEASLDELSGAAAQSPVLGRWLGDTNHVALAKDDVGVLSQIGGMMQKGLLSTVKQVPLARFGASLLPAAAAPPASLAKEPTIGPVEQPTWFSELVGQFQSGWEQGKGALAALPLPDLASDRSKRAEEAVARGFGLGSAEEMNAGRSAAFIGDQARRSQAADLQSSATQTGFAEIAAADAKGTAGDVVKAVVTNPRAVMSVVAQSLGSTAPQIALSAAMPASRIMAASVAGASSFTVEQGMTVLDVMGDQGVELTDPAAVSAFLRNKPALAAARQKGLERGVAVGAFDALTAGFAGRLVANARRSLVSIGGRVAGEGAIQAAGGAAGEATAQLASEGRISSRSDIVLEAVAEMPTFLAEGRGQIAEARRAALNNAHRFDAASEQRSIGNLVKLASQSRTRERSASRFESLVQDMTAEGEDTVYLSADGARKLFQSAQEGDTSLDGLVDQDALQEAIATGGELAIPLARYATSLTPEQHEAIADQVRLQPGARHDLPAVDPAEIEQAIADGLAAAQQEQERENGPAGQVFDDIYGQLLSRQDEKAARQNASIVQSVYQNLAERVGTDAWSLYQQFRINVPGATSSTRGAPRGVDIDVDPYLDALRSGRLPSDQEIYGESLSTALQRAGGVQDSGGELANMDAVRQRPGLVNLAGMSLDDALSWAYQEGFITEAPTQLRDEYSDSAPDINTLLDLLGRDIAGNAVYRSGAMNAERAGFRERAQSLQDELDQRGIDLQQVSNEGARRALGYMDPIYQAEQAQEFTATTNGGTFRLTDRRAPAGADFSEFGEVRIIEAFDGNEKVGQLRYANDGTPPTIEVDADHRRKGIGTAMLKLARQQGGVLGDGASGIRGRGTEYRTDDGQAFRENANESIVTLTPVVRAFNQGEESPRGSVTFMGADGARVFNIELLKGMDASTFMHEMGHVYLEVLNDLAVREGAPAQIVNDMATINAWLGRKGGMPPVVPGKVRVYHGGSLSDAEVGGVHFSTDPKYAEGYRGMNGGDGVYWLDVDESLLDRDLAMGEVGRNSIALPSEQAKAMAPVSDGPQSFTVDQHEQFARGFEAYLREGKAPSSALRRTFAAFKVWLTAIYRSARQLNVELTDDVRGVMDRLVASDSEITEAREVQYLDALISDALSTGMSPDEFEAYNEAVQAARADAETVVSAELLLAQRREQQAWYNQEKRRVREDVLAELREQAVYRAQRLMRTGKLPNGDMAPETLRVKLSKEDLLDNFGQSFLRNLSGLYAVEGGVRADEAAIIYGFGSGREMVDALVNAPRLTDAVAAETESRMTTRYPDPMTDGTLPDRAMVAAHRDKQADVMLREIRALEQHTTGRAVSQAAVIKGIAQRIIGEKKLRHLQPATYRSAEARAGREAFEAAARQDWEGALSARRRQLLNFQLFREATRARDGAARAAKYLAKFSETKTRARLGKAGHDYLDQVDALLDRFDFRKISDAAADRRSSLAAWLQRQAEKGIDVNLPQKLLDETFTTPYREMTVQDLGALRDAVKSIDHLARLKGKLMLAGEIRDAAEIDAAMAASVTAAWGERPRTTGDQTRLDAARTAALQVRVLQGTATDIARELDGYQDAGPVWRNTVGVMREAVNNQLNPALQQAQTSLAEVYRKHYTKAEIRAFNDRVPMPEVNGDLWSKNRLLALALNWGNQGNREAILTQARARMTEAQATSLLRRLDARDWAFVQDVWGLIDSQWPAIAEVQKRRTGLVPERVEATPFTIQTSDGKSLQVSGGYYPLKYEADSVKSMKDEVDDFYNSIRTGRSAKAATRNGHAIERVGSGGRTVRLDPGVVQQHLRDVLRDVHLGDAVNYVHNVLNGPEFRKAVDNGGAYELQRSMEVWLKDSASGEIGPRVWHERAMRSVRSNFTASVLTFKVTGALLQISGFIPTSVTLGTADTIAGLQDYLKKPRASTRYVTQASPYMQARLQTHVEAVREVMDAQQGRFAAGKAATIRAGFWMIARVQGVVDVATWMAAERAGMRKFGGDVAQARAFADDIVTRAQGSGEFIDKSALQRGTLGDNVRQTEWVKATTALQGYMIAKGNLAYQRTRQTSFRNPRQAMRWLADMVLLFSVEGMITAALTGKLPDDDDDDGLTDDVLEFAAKDAAGSFFGVFPGGGAMVSEFRGYDAGGAVANAFGAYADLLQQLKPDDAGHVDLDKAVIKSAVTASGVTLGLPSTQVNKTIDAIAADRDGKDVSPYEYLTGPKKDK